MKPDNDRDLPPKTNGNVYKRVTVWAAVFLTMIALTIVVALVVTKALAPVLGGFPLILIFAGATIVFAVAGFTVGQRLFATKRFPHIGVLFAVICTVISCCCEWAGIIAWSAYEATPFSSPVPYPGATAKEAWRDVGHGYYGTIAYEYAIEFPLSEVEGYYEAEMERYCVEGWQFIETEVACTGYATCRTAECEIPRPFVEDVQFFSVYLRSVSETQTNVLYIQKTVNLW